MKLLLWGAFLWAAAPAVASTTTVKVAIVHTNDIHGWFSSRPSDQDPQKRVGGAAALAAFYAKIEGPKLLLDAGDWYAGGLEVSTAVVVAVFNAIPYDAATVGEADLAGGLTALEPLVQGMRFPVLGTNVYRPDHDHHPSFLKMAAVREFNEKLKVGIFGVTTTSVTATPGYSLRYPRAEAQTSIETLRKLGAHIIVMLSHCGFEQDKLIASEVPGIDLIVGGHDHMFVHRPYKDPKNGTVIVQAGAFLSTAGLVYLDFDLKSKKIVSSSTGLVDLWVDKWGEDPAILKLLTETR